MGLGIPRSDGRDPWCWPPSSCTEHTEPWDWFWAIEAIETDPDTY